MHHDSLLARFLLLRAFLNRNQIGQDFFWYMKVSEINNSYLLL